MELLEWVCFPFFGEAKVFVEVNFVLGFFLLNGFFFGLQECILGMLASKTVVYVTHQMEFLPVADLILVSLSSLLLVWIFQTCHNYCKNFNPNFN
jgi:hypothetical protein